MSPTDIDAIKEEEDPADPALLDLLKDTERLLATILIGNNLVNVAIVILTGYAFGLIFDFSSSPALGFIVQTVILTLLLLLFGEIIPKVYAQAHPLSFSRFSSGKMRVVSRLLYPFSSFLMRTTSLVTRRMQPRRYDLSVDELSQAVDLLEGHEPEEKELFEEIINFHHKTASEIMVPRVDMTDIDISWDFHRMLSFAVESGYSRIPVYEDSEDNIKGILYLKDLIPYKEREATFDWRGLIREAYFIPENKPLDDLLEEFRSTKKHIAVVVDEYGDIQGMITLEDILTHIVGDIGDEGAADEPPEIIEQQENLYTVEGGIPLRQLNRELGLKLPLDGPNTLSGLIIETLGNFPEAGTEIALPGCTVRVLDFADGIVTTAEIRREPDAVATEED